MKKQHKSLNTIHKHANRSKYNPSVREKDLPESGYTKLFTGWRKKVKAWT